MANSATRCSSRPAGVATEAVCSFDLDSPKMQLQKSASSTSGSTRPPARRRSVAPAAPGVSHPVERRQQRRDAGPARAPRAVIGALTAAIVLLLVLIGLVAYPRLQQPARGSLTVVTTPGATVEVDGEVRGVATDGTLVLDDLEAGRGYEVRATLDRHFSAETVAQPSRGAPARVQLLLAAETSTVTIESDPTGAIVLGVADGKEPVELGKTPLTTDRFEPGRPIDLVLRKGGYTDESSGCRCRRPAATPRCPRSSDIAAEIASIVITPSRGRRRFLDGARQAGVVTPTDEILVEAASATPCGSSWPAKSRR